MTKKSKYDMPAVQNFAFGGIANPVQRAMLRGSDKQYLSDRQKELDAFEEQRLAYNDQLTKWQTEVYNPYKAQADAYNTAAQRYNEEVYNPYKTQYDTYLKSIEAYNAGPRTEDYSGPAAPTLTREFGMTAPATPTMFDRTAPVLPFKEEEVQARQQLAAERAREDASNRSVAIDVVSDPDKFNFGSMSVSNRFMAKGGEVTDDSDDRAASAIIKDFEAYGYTKEEIMELADKVAQAGRGGDELLAYLSPESVEFLKSKGGSGTINPITGLPEFKGGVIGKIVGAIKRVFNPRSAAAPATVAEPVATTPAATGPTAAELAKQLDDANKAREALATKNALELTTLKEQQAAALKAQQEASTAAQQLAIQNALKADADARAKAALPISNVINQTNAPGGLTGAAALSLMYRSTQGGVPTSEFEKYGGYGAVSKAAAAAGFNPTPKWIDSYEKSMKMPESEYTKRNKLFFSPGGGGYNNPDAGSWDGITPGGGYVPLPKAALTALPSIGTTQKTTNVTSLPANFSTIGASSGIGKIDLGGPLDVGWSRYLDKERDDARKKTPVTGSMFGDTGQRTDITSEQIPVTQPTLYQTKGVGQVGQVGAVGDVGGINITGPASPIFGTSPISRGGAATDPNSYFGLSQTSNPGINAGTTALGPSSLPVAGAVNTLNTIGSNPNLSPTMLGGANNAGFFTDRLGNKIVAPGMGPLKPPGFAKGGDIDLQALLAQNTETLSDEKPEETINTNPVGTAQKYLADLSNAGKASPTRQSIKRTKTSAGGGATAEKAMQLAYEDLAKGDLGSMKDRPPAMRNTESARSQMEELARVYQLKIRSAQNAAKGLSADTFGAPTLEGPTLTKGSLTKKRFKEGGEAKKSDAKKAESSGFFSNLFKGSDDDFIQSIKNKAEQGLDYKAMLEYLKSRDAVPDVKTGYLPYGVDAVFNTTKLPIGSGTIRINKDIVGSDYKKNIGPSTLAHEMTHATDRQLEQQASEQSGLFSKGNKFTDAYEKMVGPGGMRSGEKRTELARKVHPKWAAKNKDYRATPYEIAAHGVGNFAGSTTADDAPLHVDATAATEFQILLDLARRNSGSAVKRAEGSPVEGELSQEELDAASKPAFVTPKSGKGRKEGAISKQLKSGDAYVNMAKGVTELPYDIAGAPVDIATMLMRPFGYNTEKPVMGSDFIKEKMTKAGVRPEPPADPTAKGFYTAGELLSNLTNPAAVSRKVGPVVEKGVKAGAMEVGRQLDRAILDDAGPLSKFVPQSAKPLYAVRPTGSTMLTGNRGLDGNVITVSAMDQLLANGISNAGNVAGRNTGQAKLIAEFWDKKARNYFERQFGTPDDPIMEAIKTGRIKGSTMSSDLQQGFPAHLIDSLAQGKTRYKEGARTEGFVGPGAPEGRFFPKYPEAVEDFTSRYDKATGLKGNFLTRDPAAADPAYDMLSTRGREMAKDAADIEADKLIAQGVRPELINTEVGTVTRSVKDPTRVVGEGTSSAKAMYDAFEQAVAPGKTNEPSKTGLLNKLFGESKPAGGTNEAQAALNVLPENVLTALRKGEPVYDIGYSMDKRLSTLFKPASVNEYLATLPPRELANIRFEDAIRGGLKLTERAAALDNVASRIKAGKPVADSVFSNGVSAPLLQIKEGPLEGFAWKRIEKREATVPEGAYVGHSVGGYELGGATYTKEKREGFNTGRYQVYTLRDNRNRPVNTVEVQMLDELTPVVMQIKGNGRATGNVPAEKYDKAVLDFFENYLRPAKIEEKDELLTPLLKTYKEGINSTFKMP